MRHIGDKQTLSIFAIALILFGVGLGILLFPPFKPHISSTPIGQVLWSQGKVSSRLAQSSLWFELKKGDKLYEGQWLRTHSNSSIAIKLGEKDHFVLPPGKEIILSNRVEKRKAFIDFKVTEKEAVAAVPPQASPPSGLDSVNKNPTPVKVVEIIKKVASATNELRMMVPKPGETLFYSAGQAIHFFWQGPSDGQFTLRILNLETGKQHQIDAGNTYHLKWLPPKDFIDQKLSIQVIDKKNQLQSKLGAFRISSSPEIILNNPKQDTRLLRLSRSEPLLIDIDPEARLTDWSGELIIEDNQIPFAITNYKAVIPFATIEKLLKQKRALSIIKIKALWRQKISDQMLITPLEERWVGHIEIVTKKWWRELGEQTNIFSCDEQKQEWVCQQPIQVKIENDLSFSEAEILLATGQVLKPIMKSSHIISFCPPLPQAFQQYKILLKSSPTQIKYASDWIQAYTKVETQPEIRFAKIIKSADQKYFNLIATKKCDGIPLHFKLLDKQDQTIVEHYDLSANAHILSPQKPEHIEVAYAENNGQRLSAATKIQPLLDSLICDSHLAAGANKESTWTLRDMGKVYLEEKNSKPWTLLNWNSSENFNEFEVQIATDEQFENIVDQQITSGKSLQLVLHPHWQTIFWRVRGLRHDETTSPWSPTRTISIFKIQDKTDTPNLQISKPQE